MKKMIQTLSLALSAAILLATLSSCAGNSSDKGNAVVATVNGVEVYRWELDELYDKNVEHYQNQAGIDDLEKTEYTEQRLAFRKDLLESLIRDVVATEQAKKMNYGLTGEEKAEVRTEYEALRERNIQSFMETMYADDNNARAKAEAEWDRYLREDKHMTADALVENMENAKIREKLSEDLFKDLTPSDEELRAAYDEMVADQITKYTESPAKYAEDAALPNQSVLYNPSGFVRVKQIMISLPEDIDMELRTMAKQIADLTLESQALYEEKGQTDPAVSDITKRIKALEVEYDELFEKGYTAIQSKAEEAYTKAKNGIDFDTLIAQYGDDESMVTYPTSEYGYLVGESSDFIKGFKDAAMALKTVGEISDLSKSINGYHIIKLLEVIPEGTVSFEDAKAFLIDFVGGQPRINALDEFVSEYIGSMEINRYYDRI